MQDTQDTIVAIATPSGLGGICIVRLSGANALAIAQHITRRSTPLTPRYATLCALYAPADLAKNLTNNLTENLARDDRRSTIGAESSSLDSSHDLIDEAIVLYFAAPRSYTREDVVEFQCHGGDVIGQRVVRACVALGARMARAGEFTKRAVLSGRIDLAQANAIAQMISTQDMHFQSAMIRQLRGDLGVFVQECRESLLSALAHTEVMIDYSEEDIPSDIIARIDSMLLRLDERLGRIYDFSTARSNDEVRLSLIGKPNVGKSSLLNSLLLYDRAITSPIAGTTRDRIEEHALIDSHRVRLIDTAGIRQSDNAIEAQGIEKTKQALAESTIALAVFDGSCVLDSYDRQAIQLLAAHKRANPKLVIIPIINKADKPQKLDSSEIASLLELPESSLLHVNALHREATAHTLQRAIAHTLHAKSTTEPILSAPYQQEAIAQARSHIHAARSRLESSELELFAYHIKDALESIGHITSPYNSEEVLDSMFSQFCLGK